MVNKLEGGDGKLALHKENLRSVAKGFKDAVERSSNPATNGMKLDARAALWEFAGIRKEADDEIHAIARYFREDEKLPSDYVLRVSRICLAQYLVDKLEEMGKKSGESGKSAAVSLFACARDSVKNLLDELYFFKSRDAILDEYRVAEVILVSCAEALGVELLSLEQVQKEYGKKIAETVNSINGLH
jgi:hypothetical protein